MQIKTVPGVGARVVEIDSDGPTADTQIEVGDVVVGIDGLAVRSADDLRSRIAELAPGNLANLCVARDGETFLVGVLIGQKVHATGEAAPIEYADEAPSTERPRIGLALDNTDEEETGVKITSVDPASDAHAKGINPGDVLLSVNNQAVSDASNIVEIINDAYRSGRSAGY